MDLILRRRLRQRRPKSPARSSNEGPVSIDWNDNPSKLLRGDLSTLSAAAQTLVGEVATLPSVGALAAALGVKAVIVALALLAELNGVRTAARIARKVLAGADTALLTAARSELARRWALLRLPA
jgi:hypothetical protein